MKRGAYILFLIIFAPIIHSEILISEILPNPIGNDDAFMPNGEWIEIVISKDTDLYNWSINDAANNKIIINKNNSYIHKSKNETILIVYRNGHPSFSLNNDCDEINLTNDNKQL